MDWKSTKRGTLKEGEVALITPPSNITAISAASTIDCTYNEIDDLKEEIINVNQLYNAMIRADPSKSHILEDARQYLADIKKSVSNLPQLSDYVDPVFYPLPIPEHLPISSCYRQNHFNGLHDRWLRHKERLSSLLFFRRND